MDNRDLKAYVGAIRQAQADLFSGIVLDEDEQKSLDAAERLARAGLGADYFTGKKIEMIYRRMKP